MLIQIWKWKVKAGMPGNFRIKFGLLPKFEKKACVNQAVFLCSCFLCLWLVRED